MTETPDITSTPLDWVGKTYIQRWDTTKRFHIDAVEPCNEWYYKMTGADPTIPRWSVTCRQHRIGKLSSVVREFALTADAEIV